MASARLMSSPRAPTIARPAATYLLRLRRAPLQIFETINMTCLGIVGEHLTNIWTFHGHCRNYSTVIF